MKDFTAFHVDSTAKLNRGCKTFLAHHLILQQLAYTELHATRANRWLI